MNALITETIPFEVASRLEGSPVRIKCLDPSAPSSRPFSLLEIPGKLPVALGRLNIQLGVESDHATSLRRRTVRGNVRSLASFPGSTM